MQGHPACKFNILGQHVDLTSGPHCIYFHFACIVSLLEINRTRTRLCWPAGPFGYTFCSAKIATAPCRSPLEFRFLKSPIPTQSLNKQLDSPPLSLWCLMILVKGPGYICAVIRVHVDDLKGGRGGNLFSGLSYESGGPSVLPEIYNAYKVRESEWSDFVLDDAVIESARVQTWETSETWGKPDLSLADWLADPSKSCHEMVGKELEARDFFWTNSWVRGVSLLLL